MIRHSRRMGRVLAVTAAALTMGLLSTVASAQEIRNDVQELRRDRREVRQDSREIRGDRRELTGISGIGVGLYCVWATHQSSGTGGTTCATCARTGASYVGTSQTGAGGSPTGQPPSGRATNWCRVHACGKIRARGARGVER